MDCTAVGAVQICYGRFVPEKEKLHGRKEPSGYFFPAMRL